MSDVISFATERLTARANLVAAWLAGGEIQVYSDPRAASPDEAIGTQTLLVSFALPDPVGVVENGVITGPSGIPSPVLADGSPTWARLVDALTGATIADASVGLTGSGEAVELDNTSLITGAIVTLTSFIYAEG